MKKNNFKWPYSFLIIIYSCIVANASSQKADSSFFNLSDLHAEMIELPAPTAMHNISLNNIFVEDMRYDTSTIALNKDSYLKLGENTKEEIGKYLNGSFIFDSLDNSLGSVVVYIKSLWLSNQMVLSVQKPTEHERYFDGWKPGIACKIECFYKQKDVYSALFRFDTIFSTKLKMVAEASNLIKICLDRVSEKIINSAASSFANSKTKMRIEDVSKYYLNRFNIPILQAHKLEKGLYKNFADFQNNKPFHQEFEVRYEKLADMVYMIDSTGASSLVRDIWGYCNGSTVFVKSADNYFPLTRLGNSYFLKGFKDVEKWTKDLYGRPTSISSATTGADKYELLKNQTVWTRYKVFYNPYQLNMDNGEIY